MFRVPLSLLNLTHDRKSLQPPSRGWPLRYCLCFCLTGLKMPFTTAKPSF